MANNNHTNSSKNWLKRHYSDQYVQKAQKWNLRSRAWFKLEEIQKIDKIFQPGMTVVDLGAAPGGWSQFAKRQVGVIGRVIACDILSMHPIVGVDFIQGDLRDKIVLKTLLKSIGNNKIQVLMSDMAPNMCGISEIDITNSMYLVKLALRICRSILAPGGVFLIKVFQGDGFKKYLEEIRSLFLKVRIRKPNSSRTSSKEIYIVAIGHRP